MGQVQKRQAVQIVERVEYSGTSHVGNNTYRVFFQGGTSALTETNGSVGFAATNFAPRYNEPDVAIIVTFTRAGRIQNLERPEDQDYYLTMVGRDITPATNVTPASRVRHGNGGNHA